ncbi:MAG: hypothetical protein RL385_5250, partial [Pseudomonadota bacterium]
RMPKLEAFLRQSMDENMSHDLTLKRLAAVRETP